MMLKVGDKIQIKTWEELAREYQITYYKLMESEAVNLPNNCDFSKGQYDKICEKCEDRIDEIEKVNKEMEWYHLKNSKMIISKYVVKCEIVDIMNMISDRFEIMDI